MRISHSKLRSSFPDSTSVEEDFPSTETIPETMVLEPENLSLPNSAPSKVARQKSISRRVSVFEGENDLPPTFEEHERCKEEDSFEVNVNSNDMDITLCVGGIISSGPEPFKFNEEPEVLSMDETQCVGGIVQEFPEQPSAAAADMELTCTVGGIIDDPVCHSPASPGFDAMDITLCVGNVISLPRQHSNSEDILNADLLSFGDPIDVENPHAEGSHPLPDKEMSLPGMGSDAPTQDRFSDERGNLVSTNCSSSDEFNNLFLPKLSLKTCSLDTALAQQQQFTDAGTPTKSVIWKICSPITGRKISTGMAFSPITTAATSMRETGTTFDIESCLVSTPKKTTTANKCALPAAASPSLSLPVQQTRRISNIPMTNYSPYVERLKEDISKVRDSPLVIGTPKWRSMTSPLRSRLVELRSSPTSNAIFSSPVNHISSLFAGLSESQDTSFIEDMMQPPLVDISHSPVLRALKKSKLEGNTRLIIEDGHAQKAETTGQAQKAETTGHDSTLKQSVDLKRFLSDAGIRFLDNVTSNTTRRETLSRCSRESGEFSAKRLVLHWCISMPECELYEQSCEVLELRIADIRAELHHIECKFQTEPPHFYLSFYAPSSGSQEECRAQKIVAILDFNW
ncbi:hypothetical protein DI09_85p110 [Mitosporidium daphniae]|uniref:Spc7 kinetochore protein domain-containing protein n=1 Tax=Mitosporidium daphniae TaxID=1485682 RepID=A0A098VMG4_9MICR|nr:uncharacterized protein DI09_85p110 [Mitosporidium daphniae]KGG50160.1 hypothetical protein DI09_85p110 [Mitosporidium daphniae]|eukprot:XP_013236587.1 uncharacterized protein DI09_85p110 [Mitosporidium daphniae]